MGLKEACQAVRDAQRARQALRSVTGAGSTEALQTAERALDAAQRELARAWISKVRGSVARRGGQEADCDDIAVESSLKALQLLVSGEVDAGREESYAESCAFNGLRDTWRRQMRAGVQVELGDDAGPEAPESPEVTLLKEEERRNRRALFRAAMSCAASAPANYRYALLNHYGLGLSIPELASEELYCRITEGLVDASDPESLAKAWDECEATVNAWLSRGRRWLRRRAAHILEMADCEGEEIAPGGRQPRTGRRASAAA